MFCLYAPNTTNPFNYAASAANWVALRDHIYQNGLKGHFITQGRLKADHSNIIRAYRPTN